MKPSKQKKGRLISLAFAVKQAAQFGSLTIVGVGCAAPAS